MGIFKRHAPVDGLSPAQMLCLLEGMALRALARDGAIWLAAPPLVARLLDLCCVGALEGGPGTAAQVAALVGASSAPQPHLEAYTAAEIAGALRVGRRHAVAVTPPAVSAAAEAGVQAIRLGLEEAFFLHYALGCLSVCRFPTPAPHAASPPPPEPLVGQHLWAWCAAAAPGFAARCAAYHHLRAKGWVVRPGLVYGADFVLYRGHPRAVHSDFLVMLVPSEGPPPAALTWVDAQVGQRLARQVFKRLLLLHTLLEPGADAAHVDALDRTAVCELVVQRWVPNISNTAAVALPVPIAAAMEAQ